jgi:hypothetical protein
MSRQSKFLIKLADLMDEYDVESIDAEEGSSCGCCRGDLQVSIDFGRGSTVEFDSKYVCSGEIRSKGDEV